MTDPSGEPRVSHYTGAERAQLRAAAVVSLLVGAALFRQRNSISPGVGFALRVVAAVGSANAERVREVNRRRRTVEDATRS